jgi:hypothetical protein
MATAKKAADSGEISVVTLVEGEMHFCILGTSPLVFNRLSEKAKRELLFPQKKTTASKASTMKHDPVAEFRASPYRMLDPEAPTLLAVLPTMFKQAMGTAALCTPGAKRTDIDRLVRVNWENLPCFGIPKVFCAITRSADMNRTPDVRTRAILPEWACKFSVRFEKPLLREQTIADLLSAAGRVAGICDWRQEKGSGSFGSFKLVSESDKDFQRILTYGRDAQADALENWVAYDQDTAELLTWFNVEASKAGHKVTA